MYSIVANKPGDTSVLQRKSIDLTDLKSNEILIKNRAIGVNFIDIYFRAGLYPWPVDKDLVLGSEGAGEVEAIGSNVTKFKIGDRVAYAQPNNAYATHRMISEDLVVSIPDSISFDQAAASILKGLTVKYLVCDSYNLQSNHEVLFHAAAGGVGLIAGQWIKDIGAKLIGTAGNSDKCELAKQRGFDEVINYSEKNFLDEVLKIYMKEIISFLDKEEYILLCTDIYDNYSIKNFKKFINEINLNFPQVLFFAKETKEPIFIEEEKSIKKINYFLKKDRSMNNPVFIADRSKGIIIHLSNFYKNSIFDGKISLCT